MPEDQRTRMILLAEEVFETTTDPSQLSVTEEVMVRLREIHPDTLGEERDAQGPIAWTIVIPTTSEIFRDFVEERISERELFARTPPGARYEAIYLCSGLVLPEYRGRGLARGLMGRSIASIRRTHPVRDLFSWAFNEAGEKLAAAIARDAGLPLSRRAGKER